MVVVEHDIVAAEVVPLAGEHTYWQQKMVEEVAGGRIEVGQ